MSSVIAEISYNTKNWLNLGTSLAVQWLRLSTSTAGGTGLIPGQGTKILSAVAPSKKQNQTNKQKNWLSQKIKYSIFVLVTQLCPLFVTPWAVACQASLSMGFTKQEY